MIPLIIGIGMKKFKRSLKEILVVSVIWAIIFTTLIIDLTIYIPPLGLPSQTQQLVEELIIGNFALALLSLSGTIAWIINIIVALGLGYLGWYLVEEKYF